MNDLVPYQGRFLVPADYQNASLSYVIQPNKRDYEGQAAIVLMKDALFIAYPDGEHEVIPFLNIRETSVQDLRGISFEQEVYGKRVYVSPRDAWGVVVKYEDGATYRYSFTFLTFY